MLEECQDKEGGKGRPEISNFDNLKEEFTRTNKGKRKSDRC